MDENDDLGDLLFYI